MFTRGRQKWDEIELLSLKLQLSFNEPGKMYSFTLEVEFKRIEISLANERVAAIVHLQH